MGKRLPVTAAAVGYYGGVLRGAGDEFSIAHEKELGSWMVPDGWEPSKGAKVELGDAAKTALKRQDEAKAAANEAQTPLTFRGIKECYGPEGKEVTGAEATDHAFKAAELKLEDWNKLPENDRKGQIMASVKALVDAKQAEIASK